MTNPKLLKSKPLRDVEAKGLREALEKLDVTPANFPELEAFWKLTDDYVNHGYGASGVIKLPRLHRALRYQLCVRPSTESSAVLQYTGSKRT